MYQKIICLAAVMFAMGGGAAEVSSDDAGRAVAAWLRDDPSLGCGLRGTVAETRTCVTSNGGKFHVAKLADGGFVVTSADTTQEPIVAFSDNDDLVESDENPLWVMLNRDFDGRAKAELSSTNDVSRNVKMAAPTTEAERKWARLLADASEQSANGEDGAIVKNKYLGKKSLSDVRVAPLVRSSWNQGSVYNKTCYNYYTPNNYVCGCVATAAAQIMRYFEWPKGSVEQYVNEYCAVSGASRTLTTKGGTFDWGNMPLEPGSGITETQRKAIGKLTYDVGVACSMSYGSNASGAGGYMISHVLTGIFGYGNAVAFEGPSDKSIAAATIRAAFVSNFDAKLPVAVGINGASGGHEIVGDGYGYSDGTLYFHFNMGWGGTDNAWYAPPDIDTSNYSFSVLDGFNYNIFTNSSQKGCSICSGRVLSSDGAPLSGVKVSATKSGGRTPTQTVETDSNGIYALILPTSAKTKTYYTVEAAYDNSKASKTVSLSACVATKTTASGGYYPEPAPEVGNICDNDLVFSDIDSVSAPVFSPEPGLFYPTVEVSLSCATPGATIRYALDGSTPTESSAKYTGPFTLSATATIKAKAFKSGMPPSDVAVATYEYDVRQEAPKGDYFDDPIEISGGSGNYRIDDISRYTIEEDEPIHTLHDGGYYPEDHSAWFKWTSPGSGTIKFSASSLYVYTNGYQVVSQRVPAFTAAYVGSSIDTAELVAPFEDLDANYASSLTFDVVGGVTYMIVVDTYAGYDNGWYDLKWSGNLASDPVATSGTPVPVPYDWITQYYPSTTDFEAVAQSTGANGRPVWQSFLLALDPVDPASDLRITSFEMANGVPVIGWNVTNANIKALGYDYVVKGRASLLGGAWEPLSPLHRFFRVFVEKTDK